MVGASRVSGDRVTIYEDDQEIFSRSLASNQTTGLATLHEPDPPPFIAIEEIDHGLHPYAMDVLLDRLRAASRRTQILAATHSPTLVNRLRPDEIIVCDRDPETGASLIPAASPDEIARAVQASDWGRGELWFSGVIRGVPA